MSAAPLYPKDSNDTPIGLEVNDETLEQIKVWTDSTTFGKPACVRAACQNYVFSSEQAAALLSTLDFSLDRLEMFEALRDRLTDPEECEPILNWFSEDPDDEDRAKAAEVIATFVKAETREMEEFEMEDDGLRSEEQMETLLAALDDESFASGKLEVLAGDVAQDPSPPPFVQSQLQQVLEKFSFAKDKEQAFDFLAGPKLIYPMTCAECVETLNLYSFSGEQLENLKILKQYLKDPQNKLSIVVNFTFSGDQEEAEIILRDVIVEFEPPVPPEDEIQAALAQIGCCPAGYAWVKQPAGYRCRAGGHYVSNERIQAYIQG